MSVMHPQNYLTSSSPFIERKKEDVGLKTQGLKLKCLRPTDFIKGRQTAYFHVKNRAWGTHFEFVAVSFWETLLLRWWQQPLIYSTSMLLSFVSLLSLPKTCSSYGEIGPHWGVASATWTPSNQCVRRTSLDPERFPCRSCRSYRWLIGIPIPV